MTGRFQRYETLIALSCDLDREVLYEKDLRMRLKFDGKTLYAPTTQNRLVTVAKTALPVAVKRGLIDTVSWPQRDSRATAQVNLRIRMTFGMTKSRTSSTSQ